jgi:hypothetical protein
MPAPPRQAQNKVRQKKYSSKDKKELMKKLGMKPSDLMPNVHTWSKLMQNPFTYNPRGIGMPLNANNFPCKTVKVRNYAQTSISWPATPSDMHLFFYADSSSDSVAAPESDRIYNRCLFNAGALSGFPGVVLDSNAGSPATGIAFGHKYSGVGVDFSMLSLTNSLVPVNYDSLSVPSQITYATSAPTTVTARTYAYGIRVTYVGSMVNTKGWIEFVCAREGLGRYSNTAPSFNSVRDKDQSYRRFFFGDKRTVEYHWSPNCESVEFASIAAYAAADHTVNARVVARIGGMAEADELLIEVMHFQEFQGNLFSSISTLTPQTADAAATANALVSGHGLTQPHPVGSRDRPVSLHEEAVAHKVAQHPVLGKLANMAEGAGVLTMARKVGAKILAGAADLAGDAELLTPLLAA